MKDLGIIRRMYYRDGLSLSEIERRTGLTRKTVNLHLATLQDEGAVKLEYGRIRVLDAAILERAVNAEPG